MSFYPINSMRRPLLCQLSLLAGNITAHGQLTTCSTYRIMLLGDSYSADKFAANRR